MADENNDAENFRTQLIDVLNNDGTVRDLIIQILVDDVGVNGKIRKLIIETSQQYDGVELSR
jgi:hypothetical protein